MITRNRACALVIIFFCLAACAQTTGNSQPVYPHEVFKKKGEFEKTSSFEKRQASFASAEKFFDELSEEYCLFLKRSEHMCYRASDTGKLQIYNRGVKEFEGKWKRSHRTICFKIRCRQPSDLKKVPFKVYKSIYQ